GRLREGGAWVASIQQSPQLDPDVASALPALKALDFLAGHAGPDQAALIGSLPLAPGEPRTKRRPARFAAVQQSLEGSATGEPTLTLSTEAAATPTAAMPQQNVNLWLDLGEAAEKNRIGETVLLSLVALSANGLADAEPEWLGRIVSSLRRVGPEDEAPPVAVRAAMSH